MKQLGALIHFLAACLFSAQAAAVPITLDFQDRPVTLTPLVGAYGGFDWFGVWHTRDFRSNTNVSARGVDGTSMSFLDAPPGFVLQVADFRVRFPGNQAPDVTVNAYDLANTLVGSRMILLTSSWQSVSFDFGAPLSRLDFNASTGAVNSRFFVDNLKYQAVAEPSVLLLLGTGLGVLALSARRRRVH